jgi:hypothetical protein
VNAIEVYCDPVGVMDQAGQVAGAVPPPGPQRLFQRVQDQGGHHRPGGAPAQDPP